MKKIIVLLLCVSCLNTACSSQVNRVAPISTATPLAVPTNACIIGAEIMPWYQGNCGEMTSSRSDDGAPVFVSMSTTDMIWTTNGLVAEPGSQISLDVVVKDAQAVFLEMLEWDEASAMVVASYPLQKQNNESFKITWPFPDFGSFEHATTFALRADGIKANTYSQVNLVLGNPFPVLN